MKTIFYAALAFCILLLSGCASNSAQHFRLLDTKQLPEAEFGYVAGMFSRDWNPAKLGFGLSIVNTATAEEYVMPLGGETILPGKVTDEVGMIQLPPGEYRVAKWSIYAAANLEQLKATDISPDSVFSVPFALAPGAVVFIGSHVASTSTGQTSSTDSENQWAVRHQRLNLQTAQKAISSRYPLFAKQPMSCPTCLK